MEGKISLPPSESPLNTDGFREKVEVEGEMKIFSETNHNPLNLKYIGKILDYGVFSCQKAPKGRRSRFRTTAMPFRPTV